MTHSAGAIRIARVMAAQLSVATLAQRVLARLVQQSAVLTPPHRFSCGCCGWLWKSDECGGCSSVGCVPHGVAGGAEGVLSTGAVVGLRGCFLCHGGAAKCDLLGVLPQGGVGLTRASFHHCFVSFLHSHELNTGG